MKILLFLAVLFIVLRLLFKSVSGQRRDVRPRQEKAGERMVPCAHCGVNHPVSESITVGGKHYCTEAHRFAARADG